MSACSAIPCLTARKILPKGAYVGSDCITIHQTGENLVIKGTAPFCRSKDSEQTGGSEYKSLQWSVWRLTLCSQSKSPHWSRQAMGWVSVLRHVGRRRGGTCQLKYISSTLRTRSLTENKACVFSSSEAVIPFHTIFQCRKKVYLLQRGSERLTYNSSLGAWRFSLALPCVFPSSCQLKGHPCRKIVTNMNKAKRSTKELVP